ncbi:VOC family protein [Haladaptatus salinisoli]|uniref:VOC family protein n=1 Tax=Haladaptatus salinisoli TaxID=2884876 RepID=UPI001D0A3F95|nr:VOC family protein [Haladaptatus salinisoli]
MPTDDESKSDVDIYPMPMFAQFAVTDLDASTDWYRSVAGFREVAPLPGLSHLRYRRYADVMLVPAEADADERGRGPSLHINVEGETVSDVFERATENDATVVREPAETPWNTREVALADPDGYRIVFTEPVDTELDFETVIDRLDSK